jgi:hypothetical protein
MKARIEVRSHVLGWLLYISYLLVGLFINGYSWQGLWLTVSQVAVYMVDFYICYLLVFPRLLQPKRYGALAVALLGVVALFIGLRYLIEQMLYPVLLGFGNYGPATTWRHYVGDNLYYALPPIFVSGAVWWHKMTLRQERENLQLRQEKTQAELAFLKTQINPHFLYNTLNYLYSLAYPVSDKLASAVLTLSDLMRYMLHESPDGRVALEKEIDYLRSYMELYKLRFGEKFNVQFTVAGEPAGQRVASLLLIPFVENAFKHGVLDKADAPVCIHLRVAADTLSFSVENRIGRHQKDATSGIGLGNIRRRLALLYPNQHTLDVQQDTAHFRTDLTLHGL